MQDLDSWIGSLEPEMMLRRLVVMGLAFILALPVGWDRERATRSMGLRTFPLVAVASAAFVLIGRSTLGDSPDAHSRIMEGLVTGIGFLGGGAILKTRDRIRGTATAAAIWSTAAIGAATAWGRLEVAAVLSLIDFVALRMMRPVKKLMSGDHQPASDRLGPAGRSEGEGEPAP